MSKIHWSVRYEPLREMFEARGIDRPELVLQFSLLSSQRIAGIIRACDAAQSVAGDTAEIGCASGGTTRLIALLMQRRHWACDTFEGLCDVGAEDDALKNGDFSNIESTFDGVSARASDLPTVRVVKGRFPDSAPEQMAAARFALVHLDTDTYLSMRDGFAFFESRVVSGGLVILDDVIGRGTSGAKLFWSDLDKRGWEVVEENDPHVIVRKL